MNTLRVLFGFCMTVSMLFDVVYILAFGTFVNKRSFPHGKAKSIRAFMKKCVADKVLFAIISILMFCIKYIPTAFILASIASCCIIIFMITVHYLKKGKVLHASISAIIELIVFVGTKSIILLPNISAYL